MPGSLSGIPSRFPNEHVLMQRLTYARARLWTGILGVGTFVLLAAFLLVFQVPARLLPDAVGNPLADTLLLAGVLGLAALAGLPVDVLGGRVLPRIFGRPHPTRPGFALRWLRGVLSLTAISAASGTLLLAAGRAGGRAAAVAAFVALAAGLVWMQEPLARLVGGLRRASCPRSWRNRPEFRRVIVLEAGDPGFSGGLAGLAGRPVLPAHWFQALDDRALAVLIERRHRILGSGLRRRGLLFAIGWNAAGFLLASFLPGAGVTSVAELVTTALGFTLWTFLGLLVLPTPSRAATIVADSLVARDEEARTSLARSVETLDRLQDDEPERPVGVESVFHPVPSVANRLRRLGSSSPPWTGAWHAARTALYLAHVGLSPLPRAVHCNAGRPELWIFLPTDG